MSEVKRNEDDNPYLAPKSEPAVEEETKPFIEIVLDYVIGGGFMLILVLVLLIVTWVLGVFAGIVKL